jgi:hypothetical protein
VGAVLIGQRVILLNISSLALSFGYRFKLHDKLKISLTSKYSVAPGDYHLGDSQHAEGRSPNKERSGLVRDVSRGPSDS